MLLGYMGYPLSINSETNGGALCLPFLLCAKYNERFNMKLLIVLLLDESIAFQTIVFKLGGMIC